MRNVDWCKSCRAKIATTALGECDACFAETETNVGAGIGCLVWLMIVAVSILAVIWMVYSR